MVKSSGKIDVVGQGSDKLVWRKCVVCLFVFNCFTSNSNGLKDRQKEYFHSLVYQMKRGDCVSKCSMIRRGGQCMEPVGVQVKRLSTL